MDKITMGAVKWPRSCSIIHYLCMLQLQDYSLCLDGIISATQIAVKVNVNAKLCWISPLTPHELNIETTGSLTFQLKVTDIV